MMLLQLSGWYMYFDGNGKAIIGSLDVNLADVAAKYGKRDILNIKKVSNDKMLRNRAVVWGQFDPVRNEYAYADISKRTPWNYDSRDQRAIVISNNNIPNKSSANSIANILIKEFTKPTIEKHITLWGARDINLGDAVNINTGIWRGKGLVTTFGVTMDRNGLVTNIVLDERCPRLFGFFNFGDYVYVGTFGNGVWRKHIKFDPAWYNFSSGLTNLAITDLHINQDIFGAIGCSGELFYANSNEGPWNTVTITGLDTSSEDLVTASGELVLESFSGIHGRAVIVDKSLNTVKYGVDTFSGLNTGDYFLTYSGMLTSTFSGIDRGWIVECDPFTGQPVGGMGSGIYPINYSGNYDIRVLDLENDGINDYVSVKLGGGSPGPATVGNDHNYGHHYTQPYGVTKDYTSYTIYPDAKSIADINSQFRGSLESITMRTQTPQSLIAIDDQISGYSFVVAVGADKIARKNTFNRVFSSNWDVTRTPVTSSAHSAIGTVIGIYPDLAADTYRIFYHTFSVFSSTVSFYYVDWNALSNTWGTDTLIQTITLNGGSTGFSIHNSSIEAHVHGNTIYALLSYQRDQGNQYSFTAASHLYIDVVSINMEVSSLIYNQILDYTTTDLSGRYYYFNETIDPDTSYPQNKNQGTTPFNIHIFQDGNDIQIIGRVEIFRNDFGLGDNIYSTKEVVFAGNSTVIQHNEIYSDTQTLSPYSSIRRFKNQYEGNFLQLTGSTALIVGQSAVNGGNCYAFDGTNLSIYAASGTGTAANKVPYNYRKSQVVPVFAENSNQYLAYNPATSTYFVCSASSLTVVGEVDYTTGYPDSFVGTGFGTFSSSIYAAVYDLITFDLYLAPYDFNTYDMSRKILPNDDGIPSTPSFGKRTVSFGNFFIVDADDYSVSQPQASIYYVDLGNPEWEAASFLLLQRDGLDYNLIQESSKPIRVDISNNSPALTVLDVENSFISNFVYGNELTQIVPISGLDTSRNVRDYRYTLLETFEGTIVGSGELASSQVLYVSGSGLHYSDVETYSGGFKAMTMPSGSFERIETTNYTYPGQFLFVTTSGDNPTFYQRDNDGLIFTEYSGLPSGSRATIIRTDDIL
jgi:hypothetical protein